MIYNGGFNGPGASYPFGLCINTCHLILFIYEGGKVTIEVFGGFQQFEILLLLLFNDLTNNNE